MTDYGLNTGFSFHRLGQAYPAPAPQHAQNAAIQGQPAQQVAQVPMLAPMTYMPVQGPTYLSGGYFLSAPQMLPMGAVPGGALPTAMASASAAPGGMPGGMPGGTSGLAESVGHVTANSTNALTSNPGGSSPYLSAAGMPGGATMMPGAAGFGMAGMMAMPVGFVTLQPMAFGPVLMPMFFGFAMPVSATTISEAPSQVAGPAPAVESAVVAQTPTLTGPTKAVETDTTTADERADQLRLPIAEMSPADFKRFRFNELNAQLATSLSLNLTTADGDRVRLEFNQAELVERMRFTGKGLDGEHYRRAEFEESTNRVVSMEVDGAIDADERAAIDAVLAAVVEVANRFFSDDLGSALQKLNELDFDNPTLADLSLKMSMTHSVEHTRAYGRGGEHDLARLKDSDASVARVLDFFASEQKQLIDAASEVLDSPSAVRMVKSLLPPLLEAPFAELSSKLARSEPAPDQTAPVVSNAES